MSSTSAAMGGGFGRTMRNNWIQFKTLEDNASAIISEHCCYFACATFDSVTSASVQQLYPNIAAILGVLLLIL